MTKGGLTVLSGTLVMLTTMMGSGVIMMPVAISSLGYIGGPLGLLFIAFCSFFTLYAISYAAYQYSELQKKQKEQELYSDPGSSKHDKPVTYYNVAASYSKAVGLFVDIFLLTQGVGSCMCYVIALKTWIPKLLGKVIDGKLIIMYVMPPLYGLSLLKSLSSLRYASYLSVSSVLYVMFLCLYYSFILRGVDRSLLGTKPLKAFNTVLYKGLSIMIFAIGCHQNIIQVFVELDVFSIKSITLISIFCIAGGSLIYVTIGLAGYFVGGDGIENAVFDVFTDSKMLVEYLKKNTWDTEGRLVKIGMFAFVMVMFCAFPMQVHPGRDAFVNILMSQKSMQERISKRMYFYKSIITTIICSIVAVAALLIPSFELLINIIGATATNGITYLIPAIVFIMAVRKTTPKTMFAGLVSAMSTALCFYMIYKSVTAP